MKLLSAALETRAALTLPLSLPSGSVHPANRRMCTGQADRAPNHRERCEQGEKEQGCTRRRREKDLESSLVSHRDCGTAFWPYCLGLKVFKFKGICARLTEFLPLSLFRPSSQSSWLYTHRFAITMMLYLLLLIVIGASNSPTFVYYWHRMFDSKR